jgi:hypothetical protein
MTREANVLIVKRKGKWNEMWHPRDSLAVEEASLSGVDNVGWDCMVG